MTAVRAASPGPPVRLGLCLAAFGGGSLDDALAAGPAVGLPVVDLPTDSTAGLVDLPRYRASARYRDELARTLHGAPVRVGCLSNSRDAQLLLGLERWAGRGTPSGGGWSRYGPQPEIRFRALGAGELPWPRILSALLDEGFAGVAYIEHEDALLPRRQSIATAAERLHALLPAASPEGRTW